MKKHGACAAMLLLAARAQALSLGQVDDFQDGTTANWTEGGPSPNQPVNVADGGPTGAGDAFLRDLATGGSGPGSALVMFNFRQWTGNYLGAGITAIEADLANFGADPLYMRIAFDGAAGTQYGSTDAWLLPADGAWHHVRFDLTAVTLLVGSNTLDEVLTGVSSLRMLSSMSGPAWLGDRVSADLGVDNIAAAAAVPAPPAAWLFVSALAGLLRRRHCRAEGSEKGLTLL